MVPRPLSEHPPLLSADMSTRREMNALRLVNVEEMTVHHACVFAVGALRANAATALVNLRNVNATRIVFENHWRVIATFSEPGKLNDTRKTKVQGAYFPFFLFAFQPPLLGREEALSLSACRMPP